MRGLATARLNFEFVYDSVVPALNVQMNPVAPSAALAWEQAIPPSNAAIDIVISVGRKSFTPYRIQPAPPAIVPIQEGCAGARNGETAINLPIEPVSRMRKFYWNELTTTEFAGLNPEKTIVVVPVAATEQHGPHLPVGVDTMIAEGMIAEVLQRLPDDIAILVLPIQAIGKSNEHLRSPGTVTLTAETAIRAWTEIGEAVHRAGLRKLIFINSHGGNVDVLSIVARELRVRLQMLVVSAAWRRLGIPADLYTDQEAAVGIHAGDIETSLMLHFRPELVHMDRAANFAPATIEIAQEFAILRPTGFNAFGWIAQDLHASGAAGDASLGTAEKGRATAEFQALEFIKLLRDVEKFRLDRLA